MSDTILSLNEIQQTVRPLAKKYQIAELYVFGSYARNEATSYSDIDLLIYGGESFKPTSVFAFAEELRKVIKKEVDVFEISEVNPISTFYNTIMNERILIV